MRRSKFMPVVCSAAIMLASPLRFESLAQDYAQTKIAPSVTSKDSSAEFGALLDRLRKENRGEHEKVRQLTEKDRAAALRFLRARFADPAPEKSVKQLDKVPEESATTKRKSAADPLPTRTEQFTKIETLRVGEFAVDLCCREDGAFGLGEIRRGGLSIRRADFIVNWQVEGSFPLSSDGAG